MDKYKKLASNTIIFAIGTFSSKVLSFLLMPFVTRMMTSGDYGSADLVQQTVNVLIPIVTLQVNSAALRFSLDKAKNKSDVFTVGVRTTLAGFVVFLFLAYLLLDSYNYSYKKMRIRQFLFTASNKNIYFRFIFFYNKRRNYVIFT